VRGTGEVLRRSQVVDSHSQIAAAHGGHPLRGVATYQDVNKADIWSAAAAGSIGRLAEELQNGSPRVHPARTLRVTVL